MDNGSVNIGFDVWLQNTSHCIFPPFCSISFYNECRSTILSKCDACSQTAATSILVCVVILAILILFGNILVIISVFTSEKSARTKYDYAKSSLALADMMPGVSVFVVSAPHVLTSNGQTPLDIFHDEFDSLGSIGAKVGGVCFLFLYSSSIYHLFYMAVQRFIAIKWPFYYRNQSFRTVYLHLVCIWLFSLASGTISFWFQDSFEFSYSAHTFQYLPTFHKLGHHVNSTRDILFLFVFFGVPYIAMSVISVVTGCIVFGKLKQSKLLRRDTETSLRRNSSMRSGRFSYKKEVRALATIGHMQIGFTVTIVPLVISLSLFSFGMSGCGDGIFHFVTYYFSVSSSLVNVLIYSFRDEQFRYNIRTMALTCTTKLHQRCKRMWDTEQDQRHIYNI